MAEDQSLASHVRMFSAIATRGCLSIHDDSANRAKLDGRVHAAVIHIRASIGVQRNSSPLSDFTVSVIQF
jgi:hypothetical protein